MLNRDQLNKLQEIKNAYKAGVIKNDNDYLNMLTDFLNDEAPDEVRKAYSNDEETDATRQYEREIFADTPWAIPDISDIANNINNGKKYDTKILFNDLPEFYQHDIIKNLIGSDDYDEEDFDEYMSVLSERNEPFGGFSSDFAKKYGIKPYGVGVDILEDSGSGEGMTPDEIKKYFNHFGVDYARGDTNTQGETSYTLRGKPNNINSLLTDFNSMSNPGYKLPWDRKDVNGDGDTDLQVADTNGNGKPDTAIVTADSKAEEKEAIKAAKESLGFDKNDKTSIGKTKGELEDDTSVVSDKKKKNMTCSDVTQKNILSALIDRRF